MKSFPLLCACLLFSKLPLLAAEPYPDRFVWVFGWGLDKTQDVAAISRVLKTAGDHGLNGAVGSFGLDSLSMQSPDYFKHLEEIKAVCARNKLEFIPAVFSFGYGGGFLSHNRNLAEGLPVKDAPFRVKDGVATLAPNPAVRLMNGGFEDFNGNKFRSFDFHDKPGEVSFADRDAKHSGQASLRFEHFGSDPNGHGRVMEKVKVHPHRCYRVTVWVKTEGFSPANAFRLLALAKNHELAPREFRLAETADWRKLSMLVNSLDEEEILFYAGVWEGKAGKLWLDDWSVEEVGPVNVLSRPGTPVKVTSADGATIFAEGRDYSPLRNEQFSPWRDTGDAAPLKILPGGRIHNGDELKVSWYHSMVINDSQVPVCMAEPEVYDIVDKEAALLEEHVHPHAVVLNMDEVRMAGTCKACEGRNLGELIGECVTKTAAIIHKHSPGARIYVWSDMFDPNHNAHGDYYLAKGDFTGSWNHVPKEIVMAVWGGAPAPKQLAFSSGQGFPTLIACYYDAPSLEGVESWIELARKTPGVRGFMYTPWERSYNLLGEFGDLLKPR